VTVQIVLSRGLVAVVDDEDYEMLKAWKWRIIPSQRTFYAATTVRRGGTRHTVQMHRMLLLPEAGVEVDHVDGNGLNNTRKNIRLCTHSQNAMNAKTRRSNSSGIKGVSFNRRDKKWQARIGGRGLSLGVFTDPLSAALAYDLAAIEEFGEFAHPNFLRP
jgi:hypothetical protein